MLDSATDTVYTWPDYLDLVGGYFNDHPSHQAVTIDVVNPSDPLVGILGNSLANSKTKSIKSATSTNQGSKVLLRLDPRSVDLARTGCASTILWLAPGMDPMYGQGRVFYTALGHEAAGVARPPLPASPLECHSCGPCGDRPETKEMSGPPVLPMSAVMMGRERPPPFGRCAYRCESEQQLAIWGLVALEFITGSNGNQSGLVGQGDPCLR